jgi:hypothetical protein
LARRHGLASFARWRQHDFCGLDDGREDDDLSLEKMRELPNVPLLTDFAPTDPDRAALHMFSATASLGRPLFTTPNAPADRIAALRAAFDETMKDPDFLAAAKASGPDVDPVQGVDL